jgi:hypothetical protein
VNGICGCGLSARCCQPAVAGGFIYADLWGELSTQLAPQALFTQSSVYNATATSFLLSKHTGGGDTAPAFSGLRVCLQLTWEVGLPPSPVEFSSLRHSHKLSCSWLLGAGPKLLPSPARPSLFIYSSGKDSLPPSSALRVPHPLCNMSLLFLLLITQFLYFPRWGLVCPGGYADLAQGCLWKYCVPLSSPCGPCLPKPSGRGRLAVAWGAFLVSPFTVK